MKLFASLKLVVQILKDCPLDWAICGGIAACLYRETPRFTGDIDIALGPSEKSEPLDVAEKAIRGLGYEPIRGYVRDQNGKLLEGPGLVVGRENKETGYLGVDFLLPRMPWVADAVLRAQDNTLDYGFAALPTLVPEDLIVAKLYALSGNPQRAQDLDDVLSIMKHLPEIDREFVGAQVERLGITLPTDVKILH